MLVLVSQLSKKHKPSLYARKSTAGENHLNKWRAYDVMYSFQSC